MSKLDKLREQQKKLRARIEAVEARERQAERKRDLQRKILVGAYYLQKAEEEGNLEELKKELETFLKRNSDRVLFDLPLIEEKKEEEDE